MTLKDTQDALSSPGLGCGTVLWISQDGRMMQKSGRGVAPVSHFLPLADKKVKQMIATYGPNGSASSKSAALQSSLESKLQARLPTGGLTMFIKGWKRKVTPSGRLYCQLAVSVRPTKETGCGLWPTARAADGSKGTRTPEGHAKNRDRYKNGVDLPTAAAMWPTPNAADCRDRGSYNDPCVQRRIANGKQIGLTMLSQGTGKMESGSTARTERKGSLNPEFAFWLIGIPNAWASSIVRGMQSSRKLQRNLSGLSKKQKS